LRPTLGSWPKVSLGHGKNEKSTQMKIILCMGVIKKNILLSTNLLCLVRAQKHTNPTSTLEVQATLRIFTNTILAFKTKVASFSPNMKQNETCKNV
jgi:hypothetical protein